MDSAWQTRLEMIVLKYLEKASTEAAQADLFPFDGGFVFGENVDALAAKAATAVYVASVDGQETAKRESS